MKAKFFKGIKEFVVIYDIADNRNRTKLSRLLFEYGVRTQLSVFEIKIEQSQFSKFLGLLKRRIRSDNDKIYVYPLDKRKHERVSRIGRSENYLVNDFFI